MAEENKTKTTTTKKTTAPKKKETVEEVKVERRFCTKCGKELKEGEVCTCETVATKPAEGININTDAIINTCKGFFDTIVNMFKKPATTLKEKVNENNVKHALIMLAIIAVSYGLYIMGAFSSIISMINGYARADVNEFVDIPYFKIFIYISLIYFIVSFIPVVITYVIGRITGNRDFDFKKSISLYSYSNAPLVFTNILIAILYALNILSWLGAIIGCVVSIACFFHYILGYLSLTDISENKKGYALTGVIISWVVVSVIAIVLFAGSLISDVSKDLEINKNGYNNIYDSFNW